MPQYRFPPEYDFEQCASQYPSAFGAIPPLLELPTMHLHVEGQSPIFKRQYFSLLNATEPKDRIPIRIK